MYIPVVSRNNKGKRMGGIAMEERRLTAAILKSFQAELLEQERAPATIEKYMHDIRTFYSWLGNREVTPETVHEWKKTLTERFSPGTVNGKLAALNALFTFTGWTDCRARSLKLQRRAFRDDARELTRDEFYRLVATAERLGKERLALLLEAIGSTGVRVSEVKYFTVEAARRGATEIALKGKIRTILLPGKLCRKLLIYARKQKTASGEIFLTRSGKPINRKQIWAEMKALCKQASVEPGKVFPHNLRHLFAQTFYHQTRDVVKLADVLGHSSLSTTRIYLISTGAEHRRELEKLKLVS